MWKATRQAGRATIHLLQTAAIAFGLYLFISVLLITATGTVAVLGIWLLPETVLLNRRIAGAKRAMTAAWTGRQIPEVYQPITGPLRQRLRTAVRDPGTLTDLWWMVASYGYGALALLALPLWPVGLLVDGVRCGLLGRAPVVLPLITRIADLETDWSQALLKPSRRQLLAGQVEESAGTGAPTDALATHEAELRRIERDLHDGVHAHLVALSIRLGLALRANDLDSVTARKLLVHAQDHAQEALAGLRHVVRSPALTTDPRRRRSSTPSASAAPTRSKAETAAFRPQPSPRSPPRRHPQGNAT